MSERFYGLVSFSVATDTDAVADVVDMAELGWASEVKQISDSYFEITDAEGLGGKPGAVFTFTIREFYEGLSHLVAHHNDYGYLDNIESFFTFEDGLAIFDTSCMDATSADMLIQAALFNDVLSKAP